MIAIVANAGRNETFQEAAMTDRILEALYQNAPIRWVHAEVGTTFDDGREDTKILYVSSGLVGMANPVENGFDPAELRAELAQYGTNAPNVRAAIDVMKAADQWSSGSIDEKDQIH
jgi:hypothetical protein